MYKLFNLFYFRFYIPKKNLFILDFITYFKFVSSDCLSNLRFFLYEIVIISLTNGFKLVNENQNFLFRPGKMVLTIRPNLTCSL